MSSGELAFLSAVELRRRYEGRELSPVEVTEAALAQIERWDPVVNAYCLVDAEGALEEARASERRWMDGAPAGRLDGIPAAVKDVFLTKGWPTLRGSRLVDPTGPWVDDAPVVAALRRHGAVLLGKTTTPELGWKGVTDSPLHGVTRNPWDPELTPGGSSGGSSAALMLGMGALALGTDGGGSIRIPAGFCGHPGLKPTHGRVPLWPPSPYGGLAHAGPMARTVADTTLMLAALAEPDPRDPACLPPESIDVAGVQEPGLAGVRVAYSPDLGYVRVAPEVAEAVAGAVRVFEDLGAAVEQVHPGFEDPLEAFAALWYSGAAQVLSAYGPEQRQLLDPGLAEIAEEGARLSAVAYLEAASRRAELGVLMAGFHQRYDLLLTPTLPIPAFAAGCEVPPGSPERRWMSWTPFSYPFNLTQQPAASVPCGYTSEGLPVGLQIVGPRFADLPVLQAAHAYEQAASLPERRADPRPEGGNR